MSHGPDHHIEEAEHAAHAGHRPFDRMVIMTVAIVAAVLACVTLFAHRAHNDTLRLQGEAIRMESQAGAFHTKASNMWAYYQAQNNRQHQYKALAKLVDFLPTREDADSKKKQQETVGYWKKQVKKYEETLDKLQKEARHLDEQSEEYHHKAEEKLVESHHAHAVADRLDYGELGVEMSLVLCSLAVLTRRRGFWYAGLAFCAVGVLVALSGMLGLGIDSGGGHH
jgi:hypothetical protein